MTARELFKHAYALARTPQERADGTHELFSARELEQVLRTEAGHRYTADGWTRESFAAIAAVEAREADQ